MSDPFVRRATVLLVISTGLALNGLAQVFGPSLSDIPFTLDTIKLWILALLGSGSIVAALLTIAVIAVGYSARAHLVIAELVLAGSFGAIVTCFVELGDINMRFDDRPAAVYNVDALDKRVDDGNESPSYFVTVNDWLAPTGRRELRVPRTLYDDVRVGQNLRIVQRSGYLGLRWIESVSPERSR